MRGQTFTNTASIAGATHVLDGGAAKDWGAGEPKFPFAEIVAGAASAIATSLKIDIVGSTTIALTGSAVILSTRTILNAEFTGITTGLVFGLPALLSGYSRRYLGAILTATGDESTGYWVVGLIHGSAKANAYGARAGYAV